MIGFTLRGFGDQSHASCGEGLLPFSPLEGNRQAVATGKLGNIERFGWLFREGVGSKSD